MALLKQHLNLSDRFYNYFLLTFTLIYYNHEKKLFTSNPLRFIF